MARGKEAVASARRQVEALHAVIDRLTSENANLKVRVKRTEKDASRVPGLEEQLRKVNERIESDDLLTHMLEVIASYADAQRGVSKAIDKRNDDFLRLAASHCRMLGMTATEATEYMEKRYPSTFNGTLRTMKGETYTRCVPNTRHLSEADIRRLQMLRGDRHVEDVAAITADIEDAWEAGFTSADLAELLDLVPEEKGRATQPSRRPSRI